jgi:hypothetical protein
MKKTEKIKTELQLKDKEQREFALRLGIVTYQFLANALPLRSKIDELGAKIKKLQEKLPKQEPKPEEKKS